MGQEIDQEIQITRWRTPHAFLSLASQPNALSRPDSLRDVYHVCLILFRCWAAQRELTLTTVCRLFQRQRQVCFLISPRHSPSCRISPGIPPPLGCATPRCIAKELFKKTTEPTG